MFSPVLIHVPHASLYIPEEYLPSFTAGVLPDELMRMTDLYCDQLFQCDHEMITPKVSRLLCDVERFRNDVDEVMASVGMGAVYTSCSDLSPLRKVSEREREDVLKKYYDPHHSRFTEEVQKRLDTYGRCLIVDGHSFPAKPLPYELDQNPVRPDICIGTDPFHTPNDVKEQLLEYFERLGYNTKLNEPFAGSIVPMKYYGTDQRVSSVMIEINRGLYTNTDGRPNSGFGEIRRAIKELLMRKYI